MPEETKSAEVIDLNPKPKIIQIPQKKLIFLSASLLAFYILSLVVAFVIGAAGNSKTNSDQLVKETKVSTKAAQPIGFKKGILGQALETTDGVLLTVESASLDKAYEDEKNQEKSYYTASSSAGLNDYFNQSILNVKVALKNPQATTLSFSTASFRLKDSDDNQYSVNADSSQQAVFNLNPGETSKLTLSFTIPTSQTSFNLIYENAEISFDIN